METLSDIQYIGSGGITECCQDAVIRLLQHGDEIVCARILSYANVHGMWLTTSVGEVIAVKAGFASGYPGEGPRRFSYVLEVLSLHGVRVSEGGVTRGLINRLNRSSLTEADVKAIESSKSPRGDWSMYIQDRHFAQFLDQTLWVDFPLVVPFALIDPRLTDLAVAFWDGPSDRLLTAYKRLEDVVRKRTGIKSHGSRLFSQAFLGESAKLRWSGRDDSEQANRGQLFTATFGAFRNPRAHREQKETAADVLAEFLTVNQLFRLEREATESPAED